MNYIEQIKNYQPYNELEKKDKENILKYISLFDDVLNRKNTLCHFTSSAFIINKDRTKVLSVFHNIYQSWDWVGGHADGESDLLAVVKIEIEEETGIKKAIPISGDIFSLDITPTPSHIRKGEWISTHCHLSALYLFEADESEPLKVNKEENSGVKWMTFDEFLNVYHQPYIKGIYEKTIEKIRKKFNVK